MLRLCGLLLGGCTLLSVFTEVGAEVGVPAGYSRSSWELTQVRIKDRIPHDMSDTALGERGEPRACSMSCWSKGRLLPGP